MLCYKSTQKTRTYVSSASDLCQIKPAMGEKCINHKTQNVEYAIRIFISPLESLCSYQSCKFAVVVGRNFWFSKQWTNGNTFLLVLEAFHSGITSISLSPFVCVSDKSVGGSKKWTNFFLRSQLLRCFMGQGHSMAHNRLGLRRLLLNVLETIKIISPAKSSLPQFDPRSCWWKCFMIHDSLRCMSPINNFHVLSFLEEIAVRGSSG